MQNSTSFSLFGRALIVMASLVVVVAGMQAAASIINPILLSGVIAIMCIPVLHWLEKRGLSTWLALTVMIVGIIVIGAILITITSVSLSQLSEKLPSYADTLYTLIQSWIDWLEKLGVDTASLLPDSSINFRSQIMGQVTAILSGLSGILTQAILMIFVIIFLVLEAAGVHHRLYHELGPDHPVLVQFAIFSHSVREYTILKTWISLITGVVATISLYLLGIDFALFWGVLTFLLNYVPNLGSIIAAVPPVLLGLIQFGPGTGLAVAGIYFLLNLVIGYVVEPKIVGRGLDLSNATILIALIFWTWVLGSIGLLLSVPLTVLLKMLLENNEGTHWLAVAMCAASSDEDHDPETQ